MDTGKYILLFILKSFAFTVIWFFTWSLILHPIFGERHQISASIAIQEKQQSDMYAQQLNETGKQLAEVAIQQRRMNALLSQYEQQAARYELVLQKWEKQTAIRK